MTSVQAFFLLLCSLPFSLMAQSVEKKLYADIAAELHTPSDKIRVINLWATWCRPCVKELPVFEEFRQKYEGRAEVILVSLDFPADQDARLPAFVQAKGLQSRILAVQDTDPNQWLNLVNADWSGAIPATYIVGKDGRIVYFHNGETTLEALEKVVEPFLK
ncbi:MAG: TlpA family protein disulfide reductase [Bacteroidetes bacterium]|nr:TlpA family protein disulfide reductase [Bacteroidota bacterium]